MIPLNGGGLECVHKALLVWCGVFVFYFLLFLSFFSASCVLMDSVAFRSAATVYNLEMTVSWSRPKQDGVFRVFSN